ncbi:MAG TPA: TM0106 family RecB-like putative nuclease [Candidatus Paceibacterota bacterium]|nr:TM0106 family RecB-like putative nuclease [Candidatus Paceibacterota bacterium]
MSLKQKITGELFYKFFQCPHWIWYDLYEDQAKKTTIPPLMQMIFADGLRHDNKKEIISSGKQFKEIDPALYKDLDEAFYATLELMKQGENIYRGVLMNEHWVGMPDLLERRPTAELGRGIKSNFGDYYYVVYDIKSHGYLRDEFKFQLVFYSLILERIQGIRPKQAYLINAQGEELSFVVDDFVQQFDLNISQIQKILDGEKPAPFLKSGCKRSPWYSICLDEAQSCRDVSLIYRLNQMDQRQLYDIGIKTVDDFAAADLEVLRAQLESWPYDKLMRFHAQAQALVKNEFQVLKKSEFAEVDTEIYFDIEADPTQDIDYLLGLLIVDKKGQKEIETPKGSRLNVKGNFGTGTYKYWFADNKLGEGENWREFTDWLEKLTGSFVIYHYATYERQVFDRLAMRYGTSGEITKKFHDHTVDILRLVTDAVILPTYFYGLKDVASHLGFKWRAADAGSAESVVWYDDYLKIGNAEQKAKLRQKIVDYNEDDVRATMLVKEWLAGQKPKTTREQVELPED